MHMETFGRRCEHARSRPLLRPQANPRENPFLASHKFTEKSPMSLRVNFSRENFHARYPGFVDLALILIRGHKFARVYTSLRQLLRERCGTIITAGEDILSTGVDALPETFVTFVHFNNVILSEAKNLGSIWGHG